ncbi:MAG: tRNA (N6-isopentenyl adenosine(37)-C2)-methylthiotransferase MiaB [Candidatus Omnitrophica bacterium]|nr:tRNA (N6-isopentenyl adenosine(37)-C2)-methylthiotransferase MiaB [Candidatus Omnitrophota bacterium]
MMKKTIYVQSFGCQMNVRDAEEVTGLLLERGYRLTDSEKTADVVLFNTCSVREHAEDKVWSLLGAMRNLKAKNPSLVVGVMGCMAKAQKGKIFQRAPHVDFISGPSQLYEVPELIEAVYKNRQPAESQGNCEKVGRLQPIAAIQQKRRAEFKTVSYHSGPVSAFVTIMEGCDKVCSYCIIPYTRGPEVSRPPQQILEEVKRLADQGYKEVTLLGQNVNSYGKRFAPQTSFADLLAQVNAVPGIERIRFTTSHPWDAVEELFDAMKDLEHVCEHLHLPVQSGSDRVLERMRRGYAADEYVRKLELLRQKVPGVAVTTDIIVGFPGETEADFEATVRLMERCRFDSAFMFSYSPRPYAASTRWPDDIPQEVKDRRLQTILRLQERITREEGEKALNQTVEVLVEEADRLSARQGMGRSRTNRKVYFEADGLKAGDLVRVHVESIRGHSFIGWALPR